MENIPVDLNSLPTRGRPRKPNGKGAKKYCCYGICTSDSRKPQTTGHAYFFLRFPRPCLKYRNGITEEGHVRKCSECFKCMRWLRLCRRGDGKFCRLEHVSKDTYICSLHFVGGNGPTPENPDPLPATYSKSAQVIKSRKRPLYQGPDHHLLAKQQRLDAAQTLLVLSNMASEINQQDFNEEPNQSQNSVLENDEAPACPTLCDKSTQTDSALQETYVNRLLKQNKVHEKVNAELSDKINELKSHPIKTFEEELENNDAMCKFYTGLVFEQVKIIILFLGKAIENMAYWGKSKKTVNTGKRGRPRKFTLTQELLIVLVRLRTGLLTTDLRYRFKLTDSHVTKLVTTWVQVMFHEFNRLRPKMFAPREIINKHLPPCFKHFKNVRVLVDCTEFITQSPDNFEHQGNLFSSYKARTTFKVLIGCTPTGCISFISDAYEGSISDKVLFETCGIIDMLEPGDLVIADRGFTVHDSLLCKGVLLNIPPFLNGRNKLTPQEEMLTKKIAKVRIYVEHAVGRIKQFRLLTKTLPLSMRGILSQMIFVVGCLVNFQEPIVK